jgi:hypothetical protein
VGVFNCETFFKVADFMNQNDKLLLGFDQFVDLDEHKVRTDNEFTMESEAVPLSDRYITYKDAVEIAAEFDATIHLVKGDTKVSLPPILHLYKNDGKSPVFIFVDGGHSFETCYSDLITIWNEFKNDKDVRIWVDDINFPGVNLAFRKLIKEITEQNYKVKVTPLPYSVVELTW